jgi:hypothetical protein
MMIDYSTRTAELRKIKRGLRVAMFGLIVVFVTQLAVLIEVMS